MAIAWGEANAQKRRVITLDSPTSDLTNQTYLLKLTDTEAIANADIVSTRYVIHDWLGATLSYEQAYYAAGGTYTNFSVYAKVPATKSSPTGDQNKVVVYYDFDPALGADQDDVANAWTNALAVWNMTEGSGASVADSVGSAGGTISGCLWDQQTGKNNLGCLRWDGVNDYLSCGSHTSIDDRAGSSNAFTAIGWIYPDTLGEGNTGRIMAKRANPAANGGWLWFMDATASMGFQAVTSGGAVEAQQRGSNNACALDAWHFVALKYDNAGDRKGHIFEGGAEIGYDTDTAATGTIGSDAAGNLTIGNAGDNGTIRTFKGDIGHFRLFSVALSDAQIAAMSANEEDADNAQTWGSEETPAAGGHAGPLVNSQFLRSKMQGLIG